MATEESADGGYVSRVYRPEFRVYGNENFVPKQGVCALNEVGTRNRRVPVIRAILQAKYALAQILMVTPTFARLLRHDICRHIRKHLRVD
ncbi:hypothetical protein ASC94_00155 [Massilia sp. Root418]|nr:hypothetical protein ASC94_00155 [Massilia sp. Root418]